MTVIIEIELDIEMTDVVETDAALETRMRESARDAIDNALEEAMNEGFLHDLGYLTSINIERVTLLPNRP